MVCQLSFVDACLKSISFAVEKGHLSIMAEYLRNKKFCI